MRKIIFIVFSIILISQTSHAKWGKGELKLSKFTMENVLMYMYGAGSTKYSGADKKKKRSNVNGNLGRWTRLNVLLLSGSI